MRKLILSKEGMFSSYSSLNGHTRGNSELKLNKEEETQSNNLSQHGYLESQAIRMRGGLLNNTLPSSLPNGLSKKGNHLKHSTEVEEEVQDLEDQERLQFPCDDATDAHMESTSTSSEQKFPKVPHKLEVVVVGGGPAALFFCLLCKEYLGANIHIVVYERRWKKDEAGILVWNNATVNPENGYTRRDQVATLHNEVLSELPDFIIEGLLKKVNEEVWFDSKNIPISEVEVCLLEMVQLEDMKEIVDLRIEEVTANGIQDLKGKFDIIVDAEGRKPSKEDQTQFSVREYFGVQYMVERGDCAIGLAFKLDDDDIEKGCGRSRAENVLLNLAQTRYLLKASNGRGFLNIRLSKSEWTELQTILQPEDCWRTSKHPLALTIREGLELFNIPTRCVKRISRIDISMYRAFDFVRELEGYQQNSNEKRNAVLCLIGDAAFGVHFWPGRGLNSAIQAAIALARSLFWAYDKACARSLPKGKIPSIERQEFARFVAFMNGLQDREQPERSLAILRMRIAHPQERLQAKMNEVSYADYQQRWKETLKKTRTKLIRDQQNHQRAIEQFLKLRHKLLIPDPIDWDRMLTDESIDFFASISYIDTIATMQQSQNWSTKDMTGEAVDTKLLCQNPRKATEKIQVLKLP